MNLGLIEPMNKKTPGGSLKRSLGMAK